MKPLYVLDYQGHVRRQRATADEIRAFAERSTWAENLVHVALGDAGEIVATPVTDVERDQLANDLVIDQETRLVRLLDASAGIPSLSDGITGVMWSSSSFVIWPNEAPWAERIVREWAADRGHEVYDEPMPRTGEHWIRTMRVSSDRCEVVRLQWPSVKLGTAVLAVEVMCDAIASLRQPANRKRQEIPTVRDAEAF